MSDLLDPRDKTPPKSGLVLLQVLILAVFCAFSVRLWFLQVHRGQEFADKARENQTRQEAIYAPRGLVSDAQGTLLATNEPAYALALIREDCRDISATLDAVTRWTGVPRQDLSAAYKKNLSRAKPFETLILVPNLTYEQLAAVESRVLRWPGLEIVVRARRNYAYGILFSHILGYVAEANEGEIDADPGLFLGDLVGKAGLERTLESELRGDKGLKLYEVDVTGRRLAGHVMRLPEAGNNLTLSIDLGLQQRVGELMEGKAGVVVVMEADTGRLKALLSAPGFDPNVFSQGISPAQWKALNDDPLHPLLNRVTQAAYPPGSVFKLVMAGCGLSNHMLNPQETVHCPGYVALGKHIFRCWRSGGHGNVNLKRGLVESCDVYFYRLGMKLGVDRISEFAMACGFGKPTGIDLPHEKGGLIPTREWKEKTFGERWQKGEDLNMAIGQGYTLVTPLQMARYIAALINGGRLLKPQLLVGAPPEVQALIPLDAAGREIIRDAMVHTVTDPGGTCWRARTEGVVVGAKTGTAQVARLTDELKALPDDKIPYKLRDHAWMCGFAEADGRSYAIAVMAEHGQHGSSGAGPVVKGVIDYLFKEEPGRFEVAEAEDAEGPGPASTTAPTPPPAEEAR